MMRRYPSLTPFHGRHGGGISIQFSKNLSTCSRQAFRAPAGGRMSLRPRRLGIARARVHTFEQIDIGGEGVGLKGGIRILSSPNSLPPNPGLARVWRNGLVSYFGGR